MALTVGLLTNQGGRTIPPETLQASPRTASPGQTPEPSASMRSANGRLTYSGRSSASLGPLQLEARDYTVRWTAAAVAAQCIFRVQLDRVDGPTIELVPEALAPYRASLGATAPLNLDPGIYQMEVSGSGCEWRLRLIEADPSPPA